MTYCSIFVNGVFDILHVGHIALLETAATMGAVHVAINDDESVRRLKGPGRPVNTAEERALVLRALKAVTYVSVFHGDDPSEFLQYLFSRNVGPDYIVKGADYRRKNFPEKSVALANNCEFVFVDLVKGKSTTEILKR